MKSERIAWLDITKGIAILLVIIGHCEVPIVIKNLIYFFHMPLFFVLSGLTLQFDSNVLLKKFISKKVKRLIVPYLCFSLLLLAFKFLKHMLLNEEFSIIVGIISIFVPISGWSSSTVYGLWFLPTLFLAHLLIQTVVCLKKTTFRVLFSLLVISICLLSFIIGKVVSILSILPLALFFIFVGYFLKNFCFRQHKTITNTMIFVLGSAVCIALGLINSIYFKVAPPDISSMNLGCLPIYVTSATLGSMAVMQFSQLISNFRFSKILMYFGFNSLQYYGLHYIPLSIACYLSSFSLIQFIITMGFTFVFIYIYNLLFKTAKKFHQSR